MESENFCSIYEMYIILKERDAKMSQVANPYTDKCHLKQYFCHHARVRKALQQIWFVGQPQTRCAARDRHANVPF